MPQPIQPDQLDLVALAAALKPALGGGPPAVEVFVIATAGTASVKLKAPAVAQPIVHRDGALLTWAATSPTLLQFTWSAAAADTVGLGPGIKKGDDITVIYWL